MKTLGKSSILVLAVLALPVAAQGSLTRADASSVSFSASGPGGMKIVGSTPDLTLTDDANAVSVTVPLAHLTTGIALRDAHMRDKYLQVSSYPTAVLVVARSELKVPAPGTQLEGDASATLTLHGQSHPVVFHYGAKRGAATYTITGNVRVNMKDYGIEVPSYLGVGLKPDVDVAVQFNATDAS